MRGNVLVDQSKRTKFRIGQIVYILSNKQTIIPAMVVEQITIQTLSGESFSWKLAMGAKDNPNKPQKVLDSANINGEIFSSLDEIKRVLEAKLSNFIKTIIGQAEQRTRNWYGDQLKYVDDSKKQEEEKKTNLQKNGKIDPEELLNDLEQNIPVMIEEDHYQENEVQKDMPENYQREDLQRRLREQLETEDGEDGVGEDAGSKPMGFITSPDGKRIPINLKA